MICYDYFTNQFFYSHSENEMKWLKEEAEKGIKRGLILRMVRALKREL